MGFGRGMGLQLCSFSATVLSLLCSLHACLYRGLVGAACRRELEVGVGVALGIVVGAAYAYACVSGCFLGLVLGMGYILRWRGWMGWMEFYGGGWGFNGGGHGMC